MKKDFLSILDLSAKEIFHILDLARKLKRQLKVKGSNDSVLSGKSLVMLFEKPSLRTRLSFEVGMTQLGGHAVYFSAAEIGMGNREEVSDIAKVASSMGNILLARTFKHETIQEIARYASNPVINALSDLEHPCQILSDLLTILEKKGSLKGLHLAFVGDGDNNVTHSLALACSLFGMDFSVAAPNGFFMKKEISELAKKTASENHSKFFETNDPKEAVEGADIIYTDTWISMGREADKKKRQKIFQSYQVTEKIMKLANPDAIFMHDMPAYRGKEVTSEVIDGSQSVVIQQAENRLHAQKALMIYLLSTRSRPGLEAGDSIGAGV